VVNRQQAFFHEVMNMTRHRPNDTRYPVPALAAGLIIGAGVAGALFLIGLPLPIVFVLGLGVFLLLASSIKYADQWEKAVLMRLGKYKGLRGPGYFAVVPILDRVAYTIDQRIRTTAFGAESCLTRDTVPVNVDAIAFWIVRDAERAALEVQDYD
jgi:regulator of protease activity HflC (stomatin/prohibitin superfamily)